MNNAARIDNAIRTGPAVQWRDTGNDSISQPNVYSDEGDRLPGRTFSDINVTGESHNGKLVALDVDHSVDVKVCEHVQGPIPKSSHVIETPHKNELRAWGLDDGRDVAQRIASKYRNDPQRAVNRSKQRIETATPVLGAAKSSPPRLSTTDWNRRSSNWTSL